MQASRWGELGSGWHLVLVAALLVLTGVSSSPAHAQTDDVIEEGESDGGGFDDGEFFVPLPVDQLVELPGSCPTAAPLEPGFGIDCFFEIAPGVDTATLRYAQLLTEERAWPCRVEAGPVEASSRLVCPNALQDEFVGGSVDLTLRIEGEVAVAAATATSTWQAGQRFSLFAQSGGEIVVFDGRPLAWTVFVYEQIGGLFLNIRERNGNDIIETIDVEMGELFEPIEGSASLDIPAGRYRMWPCEGPSADTCEERPGGQPFQVIDGEPLELIAGHNRPSADRINVLFVSSGLEQQSETDPSGQLPALARTMLTIDGPLGTDGDGDIVGPDDVASRLLWGPMAIEPLASHLDRFNFWYLADEIMDEESMLFGGFDEAGDAGFDLANLHVSALYNDATDFASDARATSFETLEPEAVPPRGRIRFGDSRVWVPEFDPISGATTLAHEWGHALFGLRDEYYGFDDRGIAVGYPNCAPDVATAEAWWGDLVGEVDPFAASVEAVQAERLEGFVLEGDGLAERTAIEITAGGCYSDVDSADVYRPSIDSLMNSEVPVFGVVNRARVQEVLDRFTGRGPMTSLDDLTISCEGLTGAVTCRGELRTHLDKPLSIVAINSIPCEFGNGRPLPGGAIGPVPVTCSTVGSPNDPVELSFKTEFWTLDVVDVNPVTAPLPVESRLIPVEETEDATGDGSGRTVVIGVLLCIAALALAFVERRRRSIVDDRPPSDG